MKAIYNEIDPFAAKWMRNLIAAGHVAPGDVDERSIEDLTPADVAGHGQRHFFAGIGGWSYALTGFTLGSGWLRLGRPKITTAKLPRSWVHAVGVSARGRKRLGLQVSPRQYRG